MKQKMICLFILALAALTANAQDDFNPTPPGDPNYMYRVKVTAEPAEAGYTSGGGYYLSGSQLYISTSACSGYTFKHWTRNGEVINTNTGFYFAVGESDVEFVAVYEPITYEPTLPGDPNTPVDVSRLYLNCSPADGGSFNKASGERYNVDTWVTLTAYVNQGFVFRGWYDEDNKLLSENTTFNYLIGPNDNTLTARYDYKPTLPDNPGSTGQGDVANTPSADITGDGKVDFQDVLVCIDIVLSGGTNKKADINGDGTVDVLDVVSLIDIQVSQVNKGLR